MKLRDQIALKQTQSLCRTSFVEDFYTCKQEVVDKRFGRISIWRKRSGDDLIIMKKKTIKKDQLKQEIPEIKERMGLNHPYLLQMVDYSVISLFRNQFEVRTFFQAPLQDLKKEAKRRQNLKK